LTENKIISNIFIQGDYMNKNTRSLMAYALTISMLFNTATDNQNKKVDNAILPEPAESLIELQERKDEKLKLNKTNKKSYTK
jgi:hypothetical protein